MIDLLIKNSDGIIKAFWEPNFMMAISMLVCLIFSLPLGILLFSLEKDYNLLLYLDSVYAFVFDNYPDLDIFLYKFEFILLRYMLRELDHLDSISSIDRNDKMVLSIIDRLQRLNTLGEERPELKEIFERKDENGYQ